MTTLDLDKILIEEKKLCPIGQCDGSGIVESGQGVDYSLHQCACVKQLSEEDNVI